MGGRIFAKMKFFAKIVKSDILAKSEETQNHKTNLAPISIFAEIVKLAWICTRISIFAKINKTDILPKTDETQNLKMAKYALRASHFGRCHFFKNINFGQNFNFCQNLNFESLPKPSKRTF